MNKETIKGRILHLISRFKIILRVSSVSDSLQQRSLEQERSSSSNLRVLNSIRDRVSAIESRGFTGRLAAYHQVSSASVSSCLTTHCAMFCVRSFTHRGGSTHFRFVRSARPPRVDGAFRECARGPASESSNRRARSCARHASDRNRRCASTPLS